MIDPYPPLLVKFKQRVPHIFNNLALITLSLTFFWIDGTICAYYCTLQILSWLSLRPLSAEVKRRQRLRYGIDFCKTGQPVRLSSEFKPRTILITGASTSRGLALARQFWTAGHDIVGADCEHPWLPISPARVSRVYKKFYALPNVRTDHDALLSYANAITRVVQNEKVDLFIPCGAETAAEQRADALAKELLDRRVGQRCASLQLDMNMTTRLQDPISLRDYTKNIDMPTLASTSVNSLSAALAFLAEAPAGTKYTIQLTENETDFNPGPPVILPLKTLELTRAYLAQYPLSPSTPYALQQHISGPVLSTSALVSHGRVAAFVALAPSSGSRSMRQLPVENGLHTSLLRFLQEFSAASQQVLLSSRTDFTGHVATDFVVEWKDAEAAMSDAGKIVRLFPVRCTPGVTNAGVVGLGEGREGEKVVEAYLSALEDESAEVLECVPSTALREAVTAPVVPRFTGRVVRWVVSDFVRLVAEQVALLITPLGPARVEGVLERCLTFVSQARSEKWVDPSLGMHWDPLPTFWMYHVYFPLRFVAALVLGRKWVRVDAASCRIVERDEV